MKDRLYDINAVCKMLGITSRSLRFWEEKGIICKAQIVSGRRKYTSEQIDTVKKVIALRSVGLSVKEIQALQKNEIELRDAICKRRAALIASVEKKERELAILHDAIAVIDGGGDLYSTEAYPSVTGNGKYEEYAARCAEAIVYGNDEELFSYFGEKLRAYLPPEVYRHVRQDTLAPLGSFEHFGELVTDSRCKNVLLQYAEYEKMGLRIKLVFHGEKLEGLWLTYKEYLDDCRAALSYLRDISETDGVYLLGHSLGGQIAACLAEKDGGIDGMVLLMSSARHLADIACDQYSAARPADKASFEQYRNAAKMQTAAVATGKYYYFGVSDAYWASYNALDTVSSIKKADVPTVIINSTGDAQSFSADIALWEEAFFDAPNVKTTVYDGMSHFGYKINVSDIEALYSPADMPDEIIEDIMKVIK